MVVNLEEAGFEIKDVIAWIHGQGFPKGIDIGKAIDKDAGVKREVVGSYKATGTARAKGIGAKTQTAVGKYEINTERILITAPATEDAKKWDGWSSQLKPAMELWTLCRKPISEPTLAKNVLKHGTGAMNIKECRIENPPRSTGYKNPGTLRESDTIWSKRYGESGRTRRENDTTQGRYPANVILDEEAGEILDDQSGETKSTARVGKRSAKDAARLGAFPGQDNVQMGHDDVGGASRFFYCPKVSTTEREGSIHPTMKPVKLMEYLCKLITQPDGVILDPFMGSGTTGMAAKNLGFRFIGIERSKKYFHVAKERIKKSKFENPPASKQNAAITAATNKMKPLFGKCNEN
jgi:site-specific DNA-methyltransferase (adenine-specific)